MAIAVVSFSVSRKPQAASRKSVPLTRGRMNDRSIGQPDQQRISDGRRTPERDDNEPMEILVKVLGPIEVTDAGGRPVAVGSRRRREVLGRLVAAGGRAVPL
ncbi:hypothetical protein ABZ322_24010, partial [Streptomyces sp. NPDC006129]